MPTEKEMLELLGKGRVLLPPLSFRSVRCAKTEVGGISHLFDDIVEASWGKRAAKFAVECRSISTPKAICEGINRLQAARLPHRCYPLLFVPYLNEQRLLEIEREKISAIDLCGNGVVVAPGLFSIFRSGGKNQFPSSAPIKNIYKKNSSMVGRTFLSRSSFATVQDVCAEVNGRNLLVLKSLNKAMSLSTVSKVLKTLEADLIITRQPVIELLQADKLLQKLSENYNQAVIKKRLRLKVPGEPGKIRELLQKAANDSGLPLVASGTASVGIYATMQREDLLTVYCPNLETLLEKISGSQSDRFPNLEICEIADETVYFDSRESEGFRWASPVQAYLELMTGDKRDRETAEQVKLFILARLQERKT